MPARLGGLGQAFRKRLAGIEFSMKASTVHRVLVIEDDEQLRFALLRALELAGYSSRSAGDGMEGLRVAREYRPDIVVCDVHLPQRDGTSVLASLREEEGMESTQVILMTGDTDNTSQRRGMNLGADDYLAKPFTMEEFVRCIRARVRRTELYRKADDHALEKLRGTISRRLPHELLTPLTGILGLSEVLMEEVGQITPAEVKEMVSDIHLSADRLHHTLRNYFSILEVLDSATPTPSDAARATGPEIQKAVQEAVAIVAARYQRSADVIVQGSIDRLPVAPSNLSAIVTELVDNACKYSLPGTPISVRLMADGGGDSLVVSDRGRGMSAEQIEQIGAFRQFDRTKYEQQGLGLGLTLTQHVIERNGGSFRLESTPGQGTTAVATWARPAMDPPR